MPCKRTASSKSARPTGIRLSGWRWPCRPPGESGRSIPTPSAPRSHASYSGARRIVDGHRSTQPASARGLDTFPVRNLDIVFIDALKTEYEAYLELTVPMLKRSGLVVVDNLLWSGRTAAEPSHRRRRDDCAARFQQAIPDSPAARRDDRADRRRDRHRGAHRLRYFLAAMRRFPSGVTIVTTAFDGRVPRLYGQRLHERLGRAADGADLRQPQRQPPADSRAGNVLRQRAAREQRGSPNGSPAVSPVRA